MRGYSVWLNLALAGAAVVLMSGCSYRVSASGGNGATISFGNGAHYSTTTAQTLASGGVKHLTVDTGFGDIEVAPTTTGNIEVAATVNVNGPVPEAQLKSIADQVRIVQSASGGEVVLKPVLPQLPKGVGVGVSYVVKCPTEMVLDLRSSNGKIAATGMKGPLTARSDFGSVTAKTIGGDTDARSSNGAVELEDITGSVHARSDFGRVSVKDVKGSVEARSSNGAVEVTNATGDVKAHSDFGKVALNGITGGIDGSSSNGEVRAEAVNAAGKPVELKTDFGNVNFAGKSASLKGRSSNGKVEATLDNQPGSVELNSTFGSVVANLPPDANADINAETKFGHIDVGLKQASAKVSNGSWSGRAGSGGNKVDLKSSNGNVTVSQK